MESAVLVCGSHVHTIKKHANLDKATMQDLQTLLLKLVCSKKETSGRIDHIPTGAVVRSGHREPPNNVLLEDRRERSGLNRGSMAAARKQMKESIRRGETPRGYSCR